MNRVLNWNLTNKHIFFLCLQVLSKGIVILLINDFDIRSELQQPTQDKTPLLFRLLSNELKVPGMKQILAITKFILKIKKWRISVNMKYQL